MEVFLQKVTIKNTKIKSNNKNFNPEKIESVQTGKFELGEGEYIITVSLK